MEATKQDDDMEIRKSSTMNSMYIGSTISKPNVESIINAVATILHSQMLEVSQILFLTKNQLFCRTKIKVKRLNRTVNCFSSRRKSTSSKNPMHLIARESLC